jgi:hypothetical protein
VITIKTQNIDTILNNFKTRKNEVIGKIAGEMNKFGLGTVNMAKTLAPVDEGALRNAINFDFDRKTMTVTLGVNVFYAAFVEFGTRKYAAKYVGSLPAEWQQFAAQYKGKRGGGTFDDLVMELVRWVKIKGIGATFNIKTRRRDRVGKQSAKTTEYADAYAIARMIMINGIKPHPYLVPSVIANREKLLNNLKGIV